MSLVYMDQIIDTLQVQLCEGGGIPELFQGGDTSG